MWSLLIIINMMMTQSTVFRLGSKTSGLTAISCNYKKNNQNYYCVETGVSLENIAIVKFIQNLHAVPKKRIFHTVNSKDSAQAVFSFLFI